MTLARISGAVYVVAFVTGMLALTTSTGREITNLLAAGSYVAVTILFYFLFRPVSRGLSLLAMTISLAGCAVGALSGMRIISINPLPFFGVYCLLIGYLVYASTYLPRAIGILLMFGGVGWLTFAVPALSQALRPYNYGPGIIAEGILTLWLLFAGVNNERWTAMSRPQAG